jgi:hypothetical protein
VSVTFSKESETRYVVVLQGVLPLYGFIHPHRILPVDLDDRGPAELKSTCPPH